MLKQNKYLVHFNNQFLYSKEFKTALFQEKYPDVFSVECYELGKRSKKKKKMEISIPTPFHLFFSFFVYVLNHPEMQRKNFLGLGQGWKFPSFFFFLMTASLIMLSI